ncbi:MAG: T9SS type A sorting domain-containing protein, partial [Ignavibacteria bacterium]|nr:T9SS type A sorting domain-containing protein [Ignavibacteria bacterium]
DPWGSQSAVKAFTPTDIVMPEVKLMPTSAKSTTIKGSLKQAQPTVLTDGIGAAKDEDELMKGILLEQEGKIDEAIDYLKQLVKNKKYGIYAITELAGLKERYAKENVQAYFEDLLKDPNEGNKSRIKKHLANFYINKDEDDRAIALFDELKNDKISKKDNFEGLYEKFNLMFHKKNDIESAKNILAEIKDKFADDQEALMHIATAEILLSGNNNFAFGKKQVKKVTAEDTEVPKEYALSNNYPNPFNPITIINYQLPKEGLVTLKIYDILGNEVKILVNEQKEMGRYTVQFDASSLASGMYVYQLRANDYTSTKKMLLLK